MSDKKASILAEAAEIAMGGWHSVEKARAFACAVSDYLLASPAGAAVEPVVWQIEASGGIAWQTSAPTEDHAASIKRRNGTVTPLYARPPLALQASKEGAAGRGKAGVVALPTYGTLTWETVRAYVEAAVGSAPIIDPEYFIGHQVVGLNFNSLNRIMSALSAPGAAIAAREQSPDDELLVACITLNGATLTVEPHQMAEMFGTDDEQHAYELIFKRMTRAAYEALGEFNGF